MKIIEFSIKGTEDYSKAQDKEIEDFGKIENLLTDTISNIESGNTPTNPSEPEEPYAKYIGKYVNYIPIGSSYTAYAKYSGTAQLTSDDNRYNVNQIFTQDTNLKWQIWKIEDNTLYLISDKSPTTGGYINTGKMILASSQGYNNAVTLLDNICQANYGVSGNSNIKARNLKLEDLLTVKSEEIEQNSGDKYGAQLNTYPESGTFAFPSIWYNNERENLELAQGNRSKAYTLIEMTNSTITQSNQKPYYTYWGNGHMNDIKAWKSEEYYNMVNIQSQSQNYWLSSRCVYPISSNAGYFGIQSVIPAGVAYSQLYGIINSEVLKNDNDHAIRPFIEISLSACEIIENPTTPGTFDIVIK